MSLRILSLGLLPLALQSPAWSQIATSNEDGATGAYTSEVESSFTSEGRFGPRTALDDLRAEVDRDREIVEKARLQKMREVSESKPVTGPPPPPSDEADEETAAPSPVED
ncbi:MAG: hypothetical protein WA989_18120 [Henriciella sp.]|uniref:hypothetical protein n=1 Tax=Henriciella sp. TaxID=1968823 RepID=UPI003C73FC36